MILLTTGLCCLEGFFEIPALRDGLVRSGMESPLPEVGSPITGTTQTTVGRNGDPTVLMVIRPVGGDMEWRIRATALIGFSPPREIAVGGWLRPN